MSNKSKLDQETSHKVARLEWMYDPGAAHSEKKDIDLMNEAVDIGKDEEIAKLKAKSSGTLFLSDPSQTSADTFRRINEDPLFAIKKEENRQRQQIINNPIIRNKVREQLKTQLKIPEVKPERRRSRSRDRFERPRRQEISREISKEEQERRLREMAEDGKIRDQTKSSKIAEYSKQFR